MRVILLKGTFSLPRSVTPFKSIASVIGFKLNCMTSSCSQGTSYYFDSFLTYYFSNFYFSDWLTSSSFMLASFIYLFSSYYSFSICWCLIFSSSFAIAKTLFIFSSSNTSCCLVYLAWAFTATITAIHSCGENPNSISSSPFIKVMISHSSKPLSMNNLILSEGRWSHSLSMRLSIMLAPYIWI